MRILLALLLFLPIGNAFCADEIAPGLYVRRGADEEATPQNLNAIANVAFIVGRNCVAVIDPGGSLADGTRLRSSIRKVTALPVRYVILTHVHPDHIFGAAAFLPDKPVFIGHAGLPKALAQRGEYYRARLEKTLGPNTAGPLIVPTQLVSDRAEIDLGDRILDITAHRLAHTDSDLTVFDRQTATLFLSDLLFVNRIPALDGSLKGWLTALQILKSLKATRAVAGHGPINLPWPAAAQNEERYLTALLNETRAAIKKGIDLEHAITTVALSERAKWKLFDDYHGRNVTQAFKELEWE